MRKLEENSSISSVRFSPRLGFKMYFPTRLLADVDISFPYPSTFEKWTFL